MIDLFYAPALAGSLIAFLACLWHVVRLRAELAEAHKDWLASHETWKFQRDQIKWLRSELEAERRRHREGPFR